MKVQINNTKLVKNSEGKPLKRIMSKKEKVDQRQRSYFVNFVFPFFFKTFCSVLKQKIYLVFRIIKKKRNKKSSMEPI